MDNSSGQSNLVDTFKNLITSQLSYAIIIFILPLLGLISSNIYTSSASESWYSGIRFTLPDISHGPYGLYIATFFYLIAGGALVLIYQYYSEGFTSNIKSRREQLFIYLFYMIPILFLLIYISNPITYQAQSLLASGVLYIFATLIALIILYLTFFINNYAKWLWLVFVIWLLYNTIFYFSYYYADGRSAFLDTNICNSDNLPPPPIIIREPQQPIVVNETQINETLINEK
ncbi:unknown similar to AMEV164 [Choristoneura rosaceana entomopoxvirus 'L']|uniref:Uncharacterized protein n=2 Tax=Betaentomopoxvirus TaxID=10286 RepID=A0A916KPQ2_CBEPV|nr:unknown similar to AMEV164 [Choristoneura biennis entomopoxvirus]YP_008004578.1 unknown similar to AMEV164 [Choristoneura rosaceana entomopoxvirus 'L']CCU55774.1 unknown similar to AMEV164 [Choristoneura biennis entomopoxvirus]CCU56076.1 unknown similar to AMEV164 [Choristoneura rosaceana entomopoxvirus 'L']